LRRFKPAKTKLYLLCYAWQRYRQLTDNVVEAFCYQTRHLEDDTKAAAIQQAAKLHVERQQATPRVGELLLLYEDDALPDITPFGDVRQKVCRIMRADTLRSTGKPLTEKTVSQMDLRWQAVDKQSGLCTKNLRPLATTLEFASGSAGDKVWLAALKWMKAVFARQVCLSKQPLADVPAATLPKRLRDSLLIFGEDGKPLALRGKLYEFMVYRQLRKRLDAGDTFLDDSLQHRRFPDDLVSMTDKAEALAALEVSWLDEAVDETLDALFVELGGPPLWDDGDAQAGSRRGSPRLG